MKVFENLNGFTILTILFVVSSGGCISLSDSPADQADSPVEEVNQEKIFSYGTRPLVFNETLSEGAFYFILDEPREPCDSDWPYSPTFAYKIYDKYGLVKYQYVELDQQGYSRTIVNASFAGEAPFFVATSSSYCLDAIRLGGFTDGYRAEPPDKFHPYADLTLDVRVPAGETQGTTLWTPQPEIFTIAQAWPVERGGNQYGHIELIDPNGELAHESRFQPVGGNAQAYGITVLAEGTYKLRLNLTTLAIEDTEWTYVVQVRMFTSAVCDLGFEWEICS